MPKCLAERMRDMSNIERLYFQLCEEGVNDYD